MALSLSVTLLSGSSVHLSLSPTSTVESRRDLVRRLGLLAVITCTAFWDVSCTGFFAGLPLILRPAERLRIWGRIQMSEGVCFRGFEQSRMAGCSRSRKSLKSLEAPLQDELRQEAQRDTWMHDVFGVLQGNRYCTYCFGQAFTFVRL